MSFLTLCIRADIVRNDLAPQIRKINRQDEDRSPVVSPKFIIFQNRKFQNFENFLQFLKF